MTIYNLFKLKSYMNNISIQNNKITPASRLNIGLSSNNATEKKKFVKNKVNAILKGDTLIKSEDKYSNEVAEKLFKKLRIKFKYRFEGNPTIQQKIDILSGLFISKKAGLKLPKIIQLDTTNNSHFEAVHPKTIRLGLGQKNLSNVIVHETIHKNHLSLFNFLFRFRERFFNEDSQLISQSKSKIGNELRAHAYDDFTEFVACTGEKLLCENKKWDDLNPIIKEVYKYFKGPKLRL